MLDLHNNKYDRKVLKENIYSLKLIDILMTQTLDVTFIVRYILSDLYQLTEEDKKIDVNMVLKYQTHINKKELYKSLSDYNSDDDSIDDFESYSLKKSK